MASSSVNGVTLEEAGGFSSGSPAPSDTEGERSGSDATSYVYESTARAGDHTSTDGPTMEVEVRRKSKAVFEPGGIMPRIFFILCVAGKSTTVGSFKWMILRQ